MKPAVTLSFVRQLKFDNPRIVPFATEKFEKKSAVITNIKHSASITLRQTTYLTKELRAFLEATGNRIEYHTFEARRGRHEIVNIPIKVLPIKHNHFDGGVFIWVKDKSKLDFTNVNRVLEYFQNKGFDVSKECVLVTEKTKEGSCIFKSGRLVCKA